MNFEQQQFPSTQAYSQQPRGQMSAVPGQAAQQPPAQQPSQEPPAQGQQSTMQQNSPQQVQGPKTQQVKSQQPQSQQPAAAATGQSLAGQSAVGISGQQSMPAQQQFTQPQGQQIAAPQPQAQPQLPSQQYVPTQPVQQLSGQPSIQPRYGQPQIKQVPAQQVPQSQPQSIQPQFQRRQQFGYTIGQLQRAQPQSAAVSQQSTVPQQQLAQQPGIAPTATTQQPAAPVQQQPAMGIAQQPTTGVPQQSVAGTPQQMPVGQQPTVGATQQVAGGQFAQPARGLRLPSLGVDDIIRTEVVTATADASISSVVSEMAEYDVGCVVIVEDEVPIGLITDREIALGLKDMPDLSERTVGEVIDERVVTGTMDMTLFDLLDLMSAEAVRRIPIVDDAGRLQGIVALDDVLVLLEQKLGQAADVVKAQIPEL